MRLFLTAIAAVALAAPAQAVWYQASSEHFLIYSEQKPERIQQFAENLERFDGAVRTVRGMQDLPLSHGNRLTIFVLRDKAEVQRLAGDKSGFLGGFYSGRAEGSVVFVAPGTASNAGREAPIGSNVAFKTLNTNFGSDTILLHEYAHHLMMQDLAVPYPEWLVEGFAEFMSTAQFEGDRTVGLGLPAGHRYYALANAAQLPLETLLSGRYDKITPEQRESIYGKGWLLTHYLTFEPSRKGQLAAYLTALMRGTDALVAAQQSFGDLAQLDRDLTAYLNRSSKRYLKVSGAALNFTPVSVDILTNGGSAVLPLMIELKNGVREDQRVALAHKIRAVADRYPGDPLVELTVAEAELDAGRPETAEAAADRVLNGNPQNPDALILKGKSLVARAEASDGPASKALFEQARSTFIRANKLDREDPEPLMEFYKAFVRQGIRPTPNAIAALHYASDLAPQDVGLRMTSAMAYLAEGKLPEARRALMPVAFNPHGAEYASVARQMVSKIDAGDAKGALAAARSGTTQ